MSVTKNDKLAVILTQHHDLILERWKRKESVLEILKSKKIEADFFIKHFGSRVVDFFIGVLEGQNTAGQCPVISVMLHFFNKRGLTLDEVYVICAGMRNSFVDILLENDIKHSDEIFTITINLFDLNFAGVIKEYLELTFEQNEKNFSQYVEVLELASSDKSIEEKNILQYTSLVTDKIKNTTLDEYFAKDDERGNNIVFRDDDADDMLEYFNEIPQLLIIAMNETNFRKIEKVANILSKTSSILLHYSPYLDTLAAVMEELAQSLRIYHNAFMEVLQNSEGALLKLFDAISLDMDKYIQRFSVESLAMRNSHHIHNPTTLSIKQIISMFSPEEFEDGEMDFF